MRRRRIGTFAEMMALDPKQFKFHSIASPEESKKILAQQKNGMTAQEAYDYAKEDFDNVKAYRKDKKDLQ